MPGPCSLRMQKQIGTGSDHRNGNRNETCASCRMWAVINVLCWYLVTEYSSCLETILFTEEPHSSAKSLIFYNVINMYYYYFMRKSCFIAFTMWLRAPTLQRAWFVVVCAELGSVAVLHPQVSCMQVSIWHQYLTFLAVLPRNLGPMSSLYLHYCRPFHTPNPVINFVFILPQGCFASSLINDNYNLSKVIHYALPFLLFQL